MKPKDLIGKEFTCFEFKPTDKIVTFDKTYQDCVGKTAIVKRLNNVFPHYTEVIVRVSIGKLIHRHYPTQMIIDQIEYENKSVEELLNDMKQLTSQI
jgi:hypothetical protein